MSDLVQYSTSLIATSPFPVHLYENHLKNLLSNPKLNRKAFTDRKALSADKLNIFIRHDIDFKSCVENFTTLLELDKKYGVKSGVYFRVDDEEYSLRDYRESIQYYANLEFEIGLHTACYKNENIWKTFKEETLKFEIESGVKPISFTVHGLGHQFRDRRIEFVQGVKLKMIEFGYQFTDCTSPYPYHYEIQDCHWNEAKTGMNLFEDFKSVPENFEMGKSCIILTHPGHWQNPSKA